jgi:hypothetical protein
MQLTSRCKASAQRAPMSVLVERIERRRTKPRILLATPTLVVRRTTAIARS